MRRRMRQTHSFRASRSAFTTFVTSPSMIGSTPVTFGSSVPLCPALPMRSILFAHDATSWLVGPRGLSRLNPIPQRFFDRPVLWRAAVSRVWCTPRFYEDACVCIRCASTGGCVVFMMVVSLVLHLFLSFFFSIPRASTHSDL